MPEHGPNGHGEHEPEVSTAGRTRNEQGHPSEQNNDKPEEEYRLNKEREEPSTRRRSKAGRKRLRRNSAQKEWPSREAKAQNAEGTKKKEKEERPTGGL